LFESLNASPLNCLYFGMLAAGLVFALGTLLLSGGDGDAAEADTDADGGAGDLRIFSPVTAATFMAVFGATGLIATIGFNLSTRASLLAAALAAIALSLVVAYAYGRLLVGLHGSTDIHQDDMVGVEAMVITPIPAGGLGEVMFVLSDERITRPARSSDSRAIARGASVVVERVTGVHVVVRPLLAAGVSDPSL
jgi:membrane protein implicated in regulation of membrane protease activity